MKTLLICHEKADLDHAVLARWLASFSDLVGIVVLQEKKERRKQRIAREWKRVGWWRFLDVLAFRIYYQLFLARADREWQERTCRKLCEVYPALSDVPVLVTHNPNSAEAERFLKRLGPDIVLARCKTLLKPRLFLLPAVGTFVMHPGICPEYRNAHGCFWALAQGDLSRVGMTLLKIDKGVDTGPVYGYYSYDFDEVTESHVVIQYRVVLENLPALEQKLRDIFDGCAVPVETSGRKSAVWGQPWLSGYLKWKRNARRRRHERNFDYVS